jgi:hypothetical protein
MPEHVVLCVARRSISCQKYIIDHPFGIAQLDALASVNTEGEGCGGKNEDCRRGAGSREAKVKAGGQRLSDFWFW